MMLSKTLTRVIEASERALGDHVAPHDCYATGPSTGNPIADLVACPGCVLKNEIEDARKTLRNLAAQDQKPVAFLHETEWGDKSLSFEPAKNHLQWKDTPLYIAPPPAAGWDVEALRPLMKAGKIMAVCEFCSSSHPEGCGHYDLDDLRETPEGAWVCESCWDDSGDKPIWEDLPHVEALRHNAPPDSGAGESADATDMVDAVVYGVGISLGGHHVSLDQYYEPPTKSVPPDHGGADAGGGVREAKVILDADRSYKSMVADGMDPTEARKLAIRAANEALSNPAAAEETCGIHQKQDGRFGCIECDRSWDAPHECVRGEQPAAADSNASADLITEDDIRAHVGDGMVSMQNVIDAANGILASRASAEARLREALEPFGRLADTFNERLPDTELVREYYRDDEITVGDLRRAREALSPDPRASDCEKQGETGLATGCCSSVSPCSHQRRDPTTICETCKVAQTNGVPSDRPADVTVANIISEAVHLESCARAFLRYFNPCNLAEDKSQQHQSLSRQCDRMAAAIDAFTAGRR